MRSLWGGGGEDSGEGGITSAVQFCPLWVGSHKEDKENCGEGGGSANKETKHQSSNGKPTN